MMLGSAIAILLITTLTVADPQLTPQVITVYPPEPYPAQSAPNHTAVYPLGSSQCQDAVRGLMDLSSLCLNSYRAGAPNRKWCQNPNGCRKMLLNTAQMLRGSCWNDVAMNPTIKNVFDQIAYATSLACPTSDENCDVQADLALAMSDFDTDRSRLCSPCVKKSFGRKSVAENADHFGENLGKIRCNKVEEGYCDVGSFPSYANSCSPCWQRHYAKIYAANVRHGIEDRTDRNLRACYDNGHGDTCSNHTMSILKSSYNVAFNEDGVLVDIGGLDACSSRDIDGCSNPQCRSVLESVIRSAGCCASALPVLLLRTMRLPCLEPMIESIAGANTACFDPFTYFVDITVKTTDSVEDVCRLASEDLATTLAMLPELITCEKSTLTNDDADTVIVRASVQRYRAVGMPESVSFDPDLLQDPVVQVFTSAVL